MLLRSGCCCWALLRGLPNPLFYFPTNNFSLHNNHCPPHVCTVFYRFSRQEQQSMEIAKRGGDDEDSSSNDQRGRGRVIFLPPELDRTSAVHLVYSILHTQFSLQLLFPDN